MVFIASAYYDNHADNNLKEPEAGKSRYSLLFFLPRAKNGAIRKKSQVYRSASGEVRDIHFRTCTTANPDY